MTGIVFTTSVFAITGSFKSFSLIWAFTQGGPAHYTEVIAIYMYLNTFRYYNYGYGAAVSVIIIIFSIVLVTVARSVHAYFQRKYE
jgi:multiple sugar transport system permease protein/raffinose/stachyose/melibiose transport system permease protein